MSNFQFNEKQYQIYLTLIQTETGLILTEYEAGLCRAILDIKAQGECSGACLGSHFKKETQRFIKAGLIHKDTFNFTGVAVPTGELKKIINDMILIKRVAKGEKILI